MLRAAPVTLRRRLRGGRLGGSVASGKLAFTSFGPGEGDRLRRMTESLLRHEPDSRLLVVDDSSADDVRDLERDGRVDVRGRWRPRGYPTGLLRLVLDSLRFAVERYEFDVLLKIDTDALCLRAGAFAEAGERFGDEPGVGMLGSHLEGAAAERDDHRFAWLLPIMEEEADRDPRFGAALQAALANGYEPGEHVQGGVYAISRAALEALRERALLSWRPRSDVVLYDDVVVSMFVRAAGFRLGSLEPTILSKPNSMPLPLGRIDEEAPAAVHTVKRGAGGESEAEVRAFLASARRGA